MEAIRYMLSRPAFADHLVFAPKRVYTSEKRKVRVYSEMCTGDWWWRTQVSHFRIPNLTSLKVARRPSRRVRLSSP
jgi:Plavaka transposase